MKLLLVVAFQFLWVSIALMDRCSQFPTCFDCTSSTGCLWCSDQCQSSCASSNISQPVLCAPKRQSYLTKLARELLLFSAAAYNDNPETCFAPAGLPFQISFKKNVGCDFADNTCFGFIAVSAQQQSIVVSFRGSSSMSQLLVEFLKTLVADTPSPIGGVVQRYFNDAFGLLWSDLAVELKQLVNKYTGYKVFFTGHSLGGALASLAAGAAVKQGIVGAPVLYTFGQPRVGDSIYAAAHDALGMTSYRVVHSRDIVAHIPLCPFDSKYQCVARKGSPYHHGLAVWYNITEPFKASDPYKICTGTPINEDQSCSNGLLIVKPCTDIDNCIDLHKHYFGIEVGQFGSDGCTGPLPPFF